MLGAAGAIPNSKRPFGPMDRKSCESLFRFGVGLLARLPPGRLRPLPKLGSARQGGITSDNLPLSEPTVPLILTEALSHRLQALQLIARTLDPKLIPALCNSYHSAQGRRRVALNPNHQARGCDNSATAREK